MVLLIVAHGPPFAVAQTDALVRKADAWQVLGNGAWLIATSVGAADWRDYLGANVPASGFLVVRLSGEWATIRTQPLTEWVKSVRNWF